MICKLSIVGLYVKNLRSELNATASWYQIILEIAYIHTAEKCYGALKT